MLVILIFRCAIVLVKYYIDLHLRGSKTIFKGTNKFEELNHILILIKLLKTHRNVTGVSISHKVTKQKRLSVKQLV